MTEFLIVQSFPKQRGIAMSLINELAHAKSEEDIKDIYPVRRKAPSFRAGI